MRLLCLHAGVRHFEIYVQDFRLHLPGVNILQINRLKHKQTCFMQIKII